MQADTPAAREQFERQMEARRLEESDEAAASALRRAWFIGSETFRKQMLEQMEDKLGDHHSGELRRESAEAKAERIISEEMNRLGWTETNLATAQKTDPAKLAIAARLRRETTLPIKAIAQRVHLGTTKSANARLHAIMKETNHAPSPQTELGL